MFSSGGRRPARLPPPPIPLSESLELTEHVLGAGYCKGLLGTAPRLPLCASFPSTPPYMTQHPLLSQEGWREWGSASGGQRAPPTRMRVLGGQAETAGADLQPRPRPGWRGKGKRCMKGVVFIARSGGRNPIRAFSWEVTGKTPVGEQT